MLTACDTCDDQVQDKAGQACQAADSCPGTYREVVWSAIVIEETAAAFQVDVSDSDLTYTDPALFGDTLIARAVQLVSEGRGTLLGHNRSPAEVLEYGYGDNARRMAILTERVRAELSHPVPANQPEPALEKPAASAVVDELGALYSVADDHQTVVLDELVVAAGLRRPTG
jgi:hypothetical protein